MGIKEYLNETRQLKLRLVTMEYELEELRDRAIGQGSPDIGKLNIMTSLPADPMAEAIIEYADQLDDYHKLKRRYYHIRSRANRILKLYIKDPKVYTMITARYFNGQTYGQIAKEQGISYRKAQSIVRWEIRQINLKK